jgi:hypothetical protein
MIRNLASVVALGIALLPARVAAAQGTDTDTVAPREGSGITVWVSSGTGFSPLGDVAESYDTFGIAGHGREVRIGVRSGARHEWQVGYTGDRFRLGDPGRPDQGRRIEYVSHGLSVGRVAADLLGGPGRFSDVRLLSGWELGVSRFRVSGAEFSRYGEGRVESETSGTVLLAGYTAGFELPLYRGISMVPHVRTTLNFPDFRGGNGYTTLHRENGLGLKTFYNLAFRIAP